MTGTPAPIVVVGLACRYPDAADPAQLWQTVLGRRRAFRPIPPERLPGADYHRSARDEVDHTYVDRAAVLSDWAFDRSRFHIPGEVFRAVDLTHWLALEVAADALTDAGRPAGAGLPRDRMGVVLGNSLTGEFSRANGLRLRWPYVHRVLAQTLSGLDLSDAEQDRLLAAAEDRYKAPFPEPGEETLAGSLSNTIAGRICNYFDFHGTGYTVDGACASSLMAVATAARMLVDGDLDVALAGGVDLSLDPLELVGFARVGALAAGDMRIYDARPTGFLPGEGCGIVVLCREDFAAENGLRPYARLHGWGTSSDGNGGLTRPEAAGQLLALRRAYRRSGIAPGQISYVEGHGTGTAVGDETELAALRDLHTGRPTPAVLGSIKANIGHTKAAAGVAGLIKAVLAIHHQVIPPTTGCESPHPALAPGSPLTVTEEPSPWPGADRYASVSAMGFGGINAHVVLGGALPTTRHAVTGTERRAARALPSHEVVVCAAADPAALAERLTGLADLAGRLSRPELSDLAATLAAEPVAAGAVRFAAAVRDQDALVAAARRAAVALAAEQIDSFDPAAGVFLGAGPAPRIGYLFSGQASPVRPTAGALSELLDTPLAGYDTELALPPGAVPDTAVAQPAILRASLAGLTWLRRLGVDAVAAAGHSLGEIGALCWAGALDEKEALDLVRTRGRLMSDAPGHGAMAVVAARAGRVRELLGPGPVVVAGENGAEQCTVSGPAEEVDRFLATAAAAGLRATRLPVSHAFHSPMMAPAGAALRAHVAGLTGRAPRRPVCSTVTGDWLDDGVDLAELLTRQLVEPVGFRDALSRLTERADLLIEVGPGAVLTGLAADRPGTRVVALDAGASDHRGVATVTAALFATGAGPDVGAHFARRMHRRLTADWKPVFLRNPCETTSGPAPAPRPRPRPAPATAPAQPAPMTTAADDTDLLSAVTRRVAALVELDEDTLRPDTRLVADLHLSSLRVSQLAVDTAAAVGRAAPTVPAALADATVAELAELLATLPAAGEADAPAAGIAGWVRAFTDELVELPPAPTRPGGRRGWTVLGAQDHPLSDALAEHFPVAADPDARLLVLPPGVEVPAESIVAALNATAADGLPLVVLHHGGVGAAVGRSVVVERPGTAVMVAETPVDDRCVKLVAEAAADWTGYVEVVYDDDGVPATRAAVPLTLTRRDERIPLSAGDVLLVSGGAKGIGLECAVAVCEATGATAVLLGRSAATDPDVRAGLDRLAALGVTADYRVVDVTDAAALRAAVSEVTDRHGPVRGLLHAAGHNVPRRLEDVTVPGLRATLAPKADGFDHLVAALDDRLRFAVAFGSVIGRTGLSGQAEYAVANEWLARRCSELAGQRPGTRWLTVQWSAWSGVGMGVRLGVLDALVRDGLEPISVPAGTDLLLRLLAAPESGPAVLAAGRLPAGPTLRHRDHDRIGGRFAERVLASTPGVESVTGATLTAGADTYLPDHVVDGVPLLPAVLGLEAMAQAATALTGGAGTPLSLTDVRLERPVTVTDRRDVRVAALVRDDGRVATALRCDDTGYAVDHFAAVIGRAAVPPTGSPALAVEPGEPPLPAAGLYGTLYFHGPAFQRVRGYHALSAYGCVVSVRADTGASWFGMFLDPSLRLGDPGARDAVLHALQGCVPDRRVLPVAVDRITVWRLPSGVLTVAARQRAEDGAEFRYDVLVTDEKGRPVEEWTGLRLRAVADLGLPDPPAFLAGPALARRLRHRHPGVDAAVLPATRGDGGPAVRLADWLAGAVLGGSAGVRHAADGRLTAPGGRGVSASHLDEFVLVTVAPGPIGVDWERVGDRPPPLAEPHRALAARLAAESGEDELTAAVRVWTAIEVTRKLGLGPSAPLVFTGGEPSGLLGLRSGDHVLSSVLLRTAGDARPVAVCLGTPA